MDKKARIVWSLPSVLAMAGMIFFLLPLINDYFSVWFMLMGVLMLYAAKKVYFA